ncbi:MAG: LysR family transcriptional regulator [Pseudomonadota bacterium]
MDKFAALHAFTRVVEENGFAAAARAMGLSRSQVNKLVIGLEEDLGAQLFHRTTRKISPTPGGQAFYDQARMILNDLAEAEAAFAGERDEAQGDLKINAPMSFGTMHLSSVVADFMARHPKIRIELVLSDRQVDPVTEGFDLTIRIGAPFDTLALVDHRIVEARRVLCAAPSLADRLGELEGPAPLATAPCLHYGGAETAPVWTLQKADSASGAGARRQKVNAVMFSNNGEVLRDAAVKGVGVANLPTFIVGAALQEGRLVTLLPLHRPPSLQLCLLYPPNRHFSLRMRLFIEFFQARFGEKPYWDFIQ